ncbi:hypothetical protein GC163_06955 [bacterium]|nr:hypothetical protein [bacterium]
MRWFTVCIWVGFLSFAKPVSAELVRFEITDRQVVAEGQSFGERGSYERIRGRVYYELDPALPQNQAVVDLSLAPRNARGRVEFWADLDVLTPADPTQANGAILYDVNNRGNKLALRMFNDGGGNNPTAPSDFGHGFLMRHGFTLVWSGWDGELLPGGDRLRLAAPMAKSEDGPITGFVRCEVVVDSQTNRAPLNWANHGSYRPTVHGLETATLTVREKPGDRRPVLPRSQWAITVEDVSSDVPTQLPKMELTVEGGLQPGLLYEVIYEAQDPLVMGVGLAAVRDLMAAMKAGTGDHNPFLIDGQSYLNRAHGFGVSQSGRFLREFLWSGFNQSETGTRVFDGLMPHVAGGGLGSFNHRFAQPTRHGSQHDHHDYPPDRFPFAYELQRDPFTGLEDGLMVKALATDTAPKLMHTQSAAEYWTRGGSLPHTDPLGTQDASPPENVRFYTFGGTQHGPSGYPPGYGVGMNKANPADYRPFLRALLLSLDRWVLSDVAPPASRNPRIDAQTLVKFAQQSTGFPQIPGVAYPQVIHAPLCLDRGPRWETERIIDRKIPKIIGEYTPLVPHCDADGNDQACLLPLEVAVPVATYTGWNIRRHSAGAGGELVSLTGSMILFPRTPGDRITSSDPRLSVVERYGNAEGYLKVFSAYCDSLMADGYLLPEDAERLTSLWAKRVADLFPVTR